MGFLDPSWVYFLDEPNADFFICCLGGSTTAGRENWPNYLQKYAQKANVKEKIGVVNAGIPGYMSFNQQIFLTSWVMGKFGYRCDAVASLDGVNDIHFRIAAYTESLKYGTEWIPAYHGFQQKLLYDVGHLMTSRGAQEHFSAYILSPILYKVSKVFPYTVHLLLRAKKILNRSKRKQGAFELDVPYSPKQIITFTPAPQPERFELSKQTLNNLRNEGLPKHTSKLLKPLKYKEFVGEDEFLEAIEGQIESQQLATYQQLILKHAKKPQPPVRTKVISVEGEKIIPEEVEDQIIRAYSSSLLDLAAICQIRGIPFVSYLQPVHLQRYYNHAYPYANAANYIPTMISWQLGGNYKIDVQSLYVKTEHLYENLQKEYPQHFSNFIFLFKEKGQLQLYKDPVHYTTAGSEMIAESLIKDLIRRGILTTHE
jgi:hypothetical protein